MWLLYALLGAVFAALTAIFAKIGIQDINSNLATAIRTVVVLIMAWSIVLATGKLGEVQDITRKSWMFLILSGAATGVSWLLFYRALQIGDVSKVVPVDKLSVVITMILAGLVLRESLDAKMIAGGALIAAGTLLLVL